MSPLHRLSSRFGRASLGMFLGALALALIAWHSGWHFLEHGGWFYLGYAVGMLWAWARSGVVADGGKP